VLACVLVEDAVGSNGFGVGIGQKREGVATRVAEISRFFRGIDADGYDFGVARGEIRLVLLKAP
jgi:hypothetical protein